MMVDYPTPKTGNVTGPIQSNLSPAEVAGPYSLLAHGLQRTGAALDEVASSLADQAGVKAVTADAEGNIQVEHAPIIGPAAQHYQDAVKYAALAEGEGAVRRKDIELRTQYRNNPAGYLQAADAFAKKMQEQYTQAAGPLVGVALRKAIEPITTQTYRGLFNEKERLDLHRSVAAIDSGIEQAQNAMYAMAGTPAQGGPEWKAALDKYNMLTRQKVGNPRLAYPQEKADNDFSQFDTELRIQAGLHRAVDEYREKGYDEALKLAEKIRTDPTLNMSPAQREAAYHRVVAELNTKARDDERVLKGVNSAIDSAADVAAKGFRPSDAQIGQLRETVAATGNPQLAEKLRQTEVLGNTMADWRKLSPAGLEASIAGVDKIMREKGETSLGRALVDNGTKLLKEMRTQMGADPLGWEDRTGMRVPPVQFGSPDAPGQMRDRAVVAEMIAQKNGMPVTYLRPDEKEALKTETAKGGLQMLAVAKTIYEGFGDRAPKVMAELSKDAPALAHIGALAQSGGNTGFAMDAVEGVKLRTDPGFKMPQWMEKPNDVILAAQGARSREVFGGAFALQPDAGRAAQESANNAFFARANRAGYDPALGKGGRALPGVDTSTSEAAYDKTLQESVGAKFISDAQYGGVGVYGSHGFYGWRTFDKVLVPPNVRADKFRDVIGAINDEDLRTMGVSPQGKAIDLQKALPIAVPGGYRFAQGDPRSTDPKYVLDVLGRPFKLDFDQMEERLRKRVPDAFSGPR